MSKAKYFFLGAALLFGTIGYMGYAKKNKNLNPSPLDTSITVQEIVIPQKQIPKSPPVVEKIANPPPQSQEISSTIDRVPLLFALDSSKLPIVETISYTSRVPWLKDRAAWISDYASHYSTSRHFIARSLNKKADYFSQKVSPGDRFNVFKKDKNIQFYLLVDLAKTEMRFYYIDMNTNERMLLKTYRVGIGRVDPQKKSGFLTPIGKYTLGDRIAIYKPGSMGFFQEKKTEMIRIFGTRWIPFEKEADPNCTESAKGLGIHGAPWTMDPVTGNLVEDRSTIGKYDSDGCIRLTKDDMEELFAIIITKPTTIELVRNFQEAQIPGVEP
jgi:lipoprotein-anchoring transpeptidase ErfK/SrfK